MFAKTKKFFLAIQLCLSAFLCHSQSFDSISTNGTIQLLAKIQKNKVYLRWAPNNSIAWEQGNRFGYKIERFTLFRKKKLLKVPEKLVVTTQPVLPMPLEKWEPYVPLNKYTAIAAQALYGDHFVVTSGQSEVSRLVNQSREMESRFSFALFSADQDFSTAQYSGLALIDSTINNEDKYLYKIYYASSDSLFKGDTTFIFVNATEISEMYPPQQIEAGAKGNAVCLSWNALYYRRIYTGYFVERSDDGGKTFFSLNEEPFVEATSDTLELPRIYHYIDSVGTGYREICYRLRGKSPFGEFGPYSDTICTHSQAFNDVAPLIDSLSLISKAKLLVRWSFPDSLNLYIRGFYIWHSFLPKGPYFTVDTIRNVKTRDCILNAPPRSVYTKISALSVSGEDFYSQPLFFSVPDLFPPEAPSGLTGTIDSSGVVRLRWKRNHEDDINGYQIYRSNHRNEEYSQISHSIITDTLFYDTVPLNNLTRKLYYEITAIDQSFNHSVFSDVLELLKPDTIAPVQPLITHYQLSDTSVTLDVICNISHDVQKCLLYRIDQESDTLMVSEYDADTKRCIDEHPVSGQECVYYLQAIDESGNLSRTDKCLRLNMPITMKDENIRNIKGMADRRNKAVVLKWTKTSRPVRKMIIYRSDPSSSMTAYSSIEGNVTEYRDVGITMNTDYVYRLYAEFIDGRSSPMSQEIKVHY
jgi:uncharacterized protein